MSYPAKAYITGERTNAEAKTAFGDWLDATLQLPGASAVSELTISSGAVTPTIGAHYIDTEADAASDDLTNIVTDNLDDGRFLMLLPANGARVPTLKHESGGLGQIHLVDAQDMALTSTTMGVYLQRRGTDWYEVRPLFKILQGVLFQDCELKDYAETKTAPSSSAGVLTLNIANGNVFEVTLTENITTLTISNPSASGKACSFTLILHQAAAAKTVAWGAIKWPDGTAPDISTVSVPYILTFMTVDGGTTWYGFLAGSKMATV